jgi:SAM-dependent methyltransferase
MPWKGETFEVVWNVGVMEHFHRTVQIEGLREMHRVCKKGGLVITAVPCTRGRVYMAAKAFAERRGFWELDYEQPVESMRGMFAEVEGCQVLREYSVGFLWQFWPCRHALKLIPFARIRRLSVLVFSLMFELVNRLLFPLNYLPGSWLITICRRDN